MTRTKKDVGREVGICDKHLHMHYCDEDCSQHGTRFAKWDLRDHLKRRQDHRDDGPRCAVTRCKKERKVGYRINADPPPKKEPKASTGSIFD